MNAEDGLLQAKPPPRPRPYQKELSDRLYLDVRDTVGKWMEAQVIAVQRDPITNVVVSVRVHYLQWDVKWDENLKIPEDLVRMAEFHQNSARAPSNKVHIGMKVHCFVKKYHQWFVGKVLKKDKGQVECGFEATSASAGNVRQAKWWVILESDEVDLLENNVLGENPPRGAGAQGAGAEEEKSAWFTELRRELNQIGEQIDNLSLQAVELYSRFSDIDKDFDFAAALQSIRRLAAECDQYVLQLTMQKSACDPYQSASPDWELHLQRVEDFLKNVRYNQEIFDQLRASLQEEQTKLSLQSLSIAPSLEEQREGSNATRAPKASAKASSEKHQEIEEVLLAAAAKAQQQQQQQQQQEEERMRQDQQRLLLLKQQQDDEQQARRLQEEERRAQEQQRRLQQQDELEARRLHLEEQQRAQEEQRKAQEEARKAQEETRRLLQQQKEQRQEQLLQQGEQRKHGDRRQRERGAAVLKAKTVIEGAPRPKVPSGHAYSEEADKAFRRKHAEAIGSIFVHSPN